MNLEELKADIAQNVPGSDPQIEGESLVLSAPKLAEAARFIKENAKYRMDYVSCVTGVDYLAKGYLESVSHFYSIEKKHGPIIFKVRVPRDNAKVPSLTPLYRGAEYQEREAFDLFGIFYEGHPDLRRILMWEGFEGYPMRKDYIQENQDQP